MNLAWNYIFSHAFLCWMLAAFKGFTPKIFFVTLMLLQTCHFLRYSMIFLMMHFMSQYSQRVNVNKTKTNNNLYQLNCLIQVFKMYEEQCVLCEEKIHFRFLFTYKHWLANNIYTFKIWVQKLNHDCPTWELKRFILDIWGH